MDNFIEMSKLAFHEIFKHSKINFHYVIEPHGWLIDEPKA